MSNRFLTTIKENKVSKKELIDAVSVKSGLNKKDSEAALNAITSCLIEKLSEGDTIALQGLGTLLVKKRAARAGRNPSTGQAIQIPATNVVSFKAASKLKEAINK